MSQPIKYSELWDRLEPFAQTLINRLMLQGKSGKGALNEPYAILLYDASGQALRFYSVSADGLNAAIAAAEAGDVIWLPAGTISVAGNTSFVPLDEISSGALDPTSGTATEITGLTPDELYAIEGYNGPWYYTGGPDKWAYTIFISADGVSYTAIGRFFSGDQLTAPAWAEYVEHTEDNNHARAYFRPTGTSIYVKISDSDYGDNHGSIAWRLREATETGDLVIPAGVEVVGLGKNSVIDGGIVNNGILTNLRVTGSLSGTGINRMVANPSAEVFSAQIKSKVADGTAPMVIASQTVVSNLNADLLDGYHASDFVLTDPTMLYKGGNVSNPPTQEELLLLLGAPHVFGTNTAAHINDNGDREREYIAVSDNLYYWLLPLVRGSVVPTGTTASASHAASALTTPTYDGSGQATHPSVIDMGAGRAWNGHRYWMAMTPYPNGDNTYENPSLLVSDDGVTWVVPAGLTNPVIAKPDGIFNSDVEIILEPGGSRMWLFFRQTLVSGPSDKFYVCSSTNGVTWSTPEEILDGGATRILSPAVVWDGDQYVMYYVNMSNNPNTLERRTCATPNGTWSSASTVTLTGAPSKDIWHLCVIQRGGRFDAFIQYCTTGTSGDSSTIHFATSTNGTTFSVTTAAMLSPATGWVSTNLYRATAVPIANGYDLFYGGVSGTTWRIGRTTVTLS